jgi:reductive dehalogenase
LSLTTTLLAVDLIFMGITAGFIFESKKEQEPRAPKVGTYSLGVLGLFALLIIAVPPLRPWIGLIFGLGILSGLALFIPGKGNPAARAGADGHVVGEVKRFDERDEVFARTRSLPEGSDAYRQYYAMHPEREAGDAERRAKGGVLGRPGNIDAGYRPNVAMMEAASGMVPIFGPRANPEPAADSATLEAGRATEIVKGWAKHLGADLVGICRTDSRWTFSHRGEIFYDNWEDWGKELPEPLPYAIVFALEMAYDNVIAAPHTPTVVESAMNYAKGAYISTGLADMISALGHRAVADHSRHYNSLIVPLAVNAGLGELGRQGYLIAPKFGPRVRIFAVTTDLELSPDQPIDLGAEVFCKRCKKCAESCPSKSLPMEDKVVINGVRKWKLDEESCYAYWAKVGTDCCICMAICPFSRPDTPLHRMVRWIIRRSDTARHVLPYIDNFVYGRRWKPRSPMNWINYATPSRHNSKQQ